MPIPVPIPSGPRPITDEHNAQAEAFVEAITQIFKNGTTGASLLTPPTLYVDGPDPEEDVFGKPILKPLVIATAKEQLYYRQLALAIVQTITGTQGTVGPPGPAGPPGFNWLGTWNSTTAYEVDDAVQWQGSSYICLQANTNSAPPSAAWDLFASKGDPWTPPPPAFSVGLSLNTSVIETGQAYVRPTFTASYNRTPTSAVLVDSNGNPSTNVLATPTSFSSPYTFTKTIPDSSVSFTLQAADDTGSASSEAVLYWRQKVYWGTALQGSGSASVIKALSGSQLTNTRLRSFTVTAGPTETIFYAYRAAYGFSSFWVGGFEGGFLSPILMPITNNYGVTENYYVYESVQPGLGTTTVTVTVP